MSIATGTDDDGSGVLDAREISATQIVCNGLGSLVETRALEPDAAVCAAGGLGVRVGIDRDASGSLSDTEITTSHDLCEGDNSLIDIEALAPKHSTRRRAIHRAPNIRRP